MYHAWFEANKNWKRVLSTGTKNFTKKETSFLCVATPETTHSTLWHRNDND
jgi:hypothetical protein